MAIYLRIMRDRSNAFLEINHSYKAKEYVDWKFSVLKSICRSGPKLRKGNGSRLAYRFFTRQHPELTQIYKEFYREGRKIVPDDLSLNEQVLSVWFMDDGSRCGQSYYLNSQQFSKYEQLALIEKLKLLGLSARLNKDKHYYRIRFLSNSSLRLKELLATKIIQSMHYKL